MVGLCDVNYILSDNSEIFNIKGGLINKKYFYPVRDICRYIIKDSAILDLSNVNPTELNTVFYNIDLAFFIKQLINCFQKKASIIIYNFDNNLFLNINSVNDINIMLTNVNNNPITDFIINNNSILLFNDSTYNIDSYTKYNNELELVLDEPIDIISRTNLIILSNFDNNIIINYDNTYNTNLIGVFIEYKEVLDLTTDLSHIYYDCLNEIKDNINQIYNNYPIVINKSSYKAIIDVKYDNVTKYIQNFFINNLYQIYQDVISVNASFIEKGTDSYIINDIFSLLNDYLTIRFNLSDFNVKLFNNILTFKNLIIYNNINNILFFEVTSYSIGDYYIDITVKLKDFNYVSDIFITKSSLLSYQPPIGFIPVLKNLNKKMYTHEFLFNFIE